MCEFSIPTNSLLGQCAEQRTLSADTNEENLVSLTKGVNIVTIKRDGELLLSQVVCPMGE